MDEFLIKSRIIRTSFFQRNRIRREDFFKQIYVSISRISLEFADPKSTIYQTSNIDSLKLCLGNIKEQIQQLTKINHQTTNDIDEIWKELIIQKGKTAGIASDTETIRNQLTQLLQTIEIEASKKKGLKNRIGNITKGVGLDIIDNILYDIAKIALTGNF